MINAINWLTLPIRIATATVVIVLALLIVLLVSITPNKLTGLRK